MLKLVTLDQFLQWTTICMTFQTSHCTQMTLTVTTQAPAAENPIPPTATDDESIEEGDRIFATCFHNEPAEVCATHRNGPSQDCRCCKPAQTPEQERGAVIPWVHQFLLAVHSDFLTPCAAAFRPHGKKAVLYTPPPILVDSNWTPNCPRKS
jgi:hypothetical protein